MSGESSPPAETADREVSYLKFFSLDRESLHLRLSALVPIALQQLRERFQLRMLRVRDEREAIAAIWSACTSFLSHCRDGDFTDAKTPDELAGHLLRIAANRANRAYRQGVRAEAEVGRGRSRESEGKLPLADQKDDFPSPIENAIRREVTEHLRVIIDSIREGLRNREKPLQIVELYLEDMERSQGEIARDAGTSQATVSRWITWFKDEVRRLLIESGGL